MNPLEKEILVLLRALSQQEALKHLILIGSWATLFYKGYFQSPDYHPVIRTTDIDFLIPKKPFAKLNLSQTLTDLGFLEEFKNSGWVTFHKPDLHVEFLLPRFGPQSDQVRSVPELGINAQPLRFMSLLIHHTIQCNYEELQLTLPHPAAYGVHKLIISSRRLNQTKVEKDREQAEAVLTALTKPEDLDLLKQILKESSKKEKKSISESLKERPLLGELLVPFL